MPDFSSLEHDVVQVAINEELRGLEDKFLKEMADICTKYRLNVFSAWSVLSIEINSMCMSQMLNRIEELENGKSTEAD